MASEAIKIVIIRGIHIKLGVIRATEYNFEIRSHLWGCLEITRASETTTIAISGNMHIDNSVIYPSYYKFEA